MRDILFRGKRKDNDGWLWGDLLQDRDLGICLIEGFDYYTDADGLQRDYFQHEVIPETVGQYTGLTDKNGKKIFEGDILEFSDRLVSVFWHAHLGCWDSNFLKFTNEDNGKEDMSPCRWEYRAKVIGNIHDNPELLEDKK